MKLPVHLLQSRAVHMGVDLRGRDIGMAQHRLHRAQIRSAFEQMGGEGMAQSVRRHPLVDARL